MAFKKYPMRRRARKPKGSGKPSVKQVKSIVRRTINRSIETKQFWTQIDEQPLSNFSNQTSIQQLDGIFQGVGQSDRIGNVVKLQGLHIKGVINNNFTSTVFVRMVIFYTNSQTAVTNLTGSELFLGVGGVPVSTGGLLLNAIYQPINKNLITVLADKTYRMGGSNESSGTCATVFSKFIKLYGKKIVFDGNGSGSGNMNKRLQVAFISANAADDDSGETTLDLSYIARLYYKDG